MGVNSFEKTLWNLVPSGTTLYVAIPTEGGSKSKNDLIEMKARKKGFRMNPGITYFPVLVVNIFKVETGEIVTKNFEKRSCGPSQRT